MTPAEWTQGKWPEIIERLIGPGYVDGKHHPCPRGDGTNCFRFSNINGKGNYFCRCSQGDQDGFDLIQCYHNTDFAGAAKLVEEIIGPREQDRQPRRSYAERLRTEARKSPRSRYLESRGLVMPPGLLWHPAVDYFVDGERIKSYPAMLAPITRDGRFLTFHVTYLEDGHKAPVDPCRKMLPGPGLKGAAVELWPHNEVLGIAEGIETAIAAHMLFKVPVWAALNTSLLKSFTPPDQVKRLVIFGDNDTNHAGQAAAYALAHRLHDRVEIEIKFPDSPGDFNDVLIARQEAA